MRLILTALLAAIWTAGCPAAPPASEPVDNEGPTANVPAAAAPDAAPTPEPPATEVWFHDDEAAAIAEAKRLSRPLVIDFWAPWCHTCLSMQRTVMVDPASAALRAKFVWLAIDTDRPANEAIVARYPVTSWPTYLVVQPGDGTVLARQLGSTDRAGFDAFMNNGLRDDAAAPDTKGPDQALRAGAQAAAKGEFEAAKASYAKALSLGGANWEGACAARVAWLDVARKKGEPIAVLTEALPKLEAMQACKNATQADFIAIGARLATKIGDGDARLVTYWRTTGIARLDVLVSDKDITWTADDRSELFRILRELLLTQDQEERARAIAEAQARVLDRATHAAKTAEERATWHWPRAEVYTFLGRPEALVEDLLADVNAMPESYDAPYRLAWILLQAKQYENALAAADSALSKVYGPRTKRVKALRESILEAQKAAPKRAPVPEKRAPAPAGEPEPEAPILPAKTP